MSEWALARFTKSGGSRERREQRDTKKGRASERELFLFRLNFVQLLKFMTTCRAAANRGLRRRDRRAFVRPHTPNSGLGAKRVAGMLAKDFLPPHADFLRFDFL